MEVCVCVLERSLWRQFWNYILFSVMHTVVVILKRPPSWSLRLTGPDTVVQCMCVLVLGESASLLWAQSQRQQVQLTHTGFLAGRASWGTERERMSERQKDRSDLWVLPDQCIYLPYSSPRTVCDNQGNMTWTAQTCPQLQRCAWVCFFLWFYKYKDCLELKQ